MPSGLITAICEADIAQALAGPAPVLPIGAQSSLTGGATPMGEVVLATNRLNRILDIGADTVRVESGVALTDLDQALRRAGRYYPPVPTFLGATVGGTIATNAAGAATFKYGTTRDWVDGAHSRAAERRASSTSNAGPSTLTPTATSRSCRRAPPPACRFPATACPRRPSCRPATLPRRKWTSSICSSAPKAHLGSSPKRRSACCRSGRRCASRSCRSRSRAGALAFVRQLRGLARDTWRTHDPNGIDVSAIEHMDARCLELLREDGVDRQHGVTIPPATEMALLVTLELPAGTTSARAYEDIGTARDPDAPDGPLRRFCRLLDAAGVLDDVDVAVPGDDTRANQLLAVREAVPAAVNQRVGRAKQSIDNRIEKTAADMVVPFDRLEELLTAYETGFGARGLDFAIWGHVSDGNLHPNVIPRSLADVESGKAAIVELGREAIRLGGAPLAEHGVGRNRVKQRLLEQLYGMDGIDDMRAVKLAIDPEWKLSPGVLFTRTSTSG